MSEKSQQTTEQVQLVGDAHDRLLWYQQDDERLGETLERVLLSLPHPKDLPSETIDGEWAGTRMRNPEGRINWSIEDPQRVATALARERNR